VGGPLSEVTEPDGVRHLVLDTDLAMGAPGSDIDDGFALALALADPGLRVDLVTTVGGNTDVDTATRLTGDLLAMLGREVPVVRGAGGPINPRWRRPDRDLVPDPGLATGSYAATAIAELVMREPGRTTIVAIGPLTNVALALLLEPRVATAVREIVVMGGVFRGQTNVGWMPGEFNFWCDPDAVAVVLASGAPLSLVGLDVTRQVRLTRAEAERLGEGDGRFAPLAAAHTLAWIEHQERVKPHEELEQGGCALHDPLAVAAVARPELVTWQPAHVSVEVASATTRGVAVADLLMWEDPPEPNCRVATDVDAAAFGRYFLERLASLP
jgi:purine nucleosidase